MFILQWQTILDVGNTTVTEVYHVSAPVEFSFMPREPK